MATKMTVQFNLFGGTALPALYKHSIHLLMSAWSVASRSLTPSLLVCAVLQWVVCHVSDILLAYDMITSLA